MRPNRLLAPLWTGRLREWALVAGLTAALLAVLWKQWVHVQVRAELAAIQTTVGALRTAFAIDYMERMVRANSGPKVAAQHNPFLILKDVPVNYAGELHRGKTDRLSPGTWVFDPDCVCIGYTLLRPDGPSGGVDGPSLWFRVSGPDGGPLQLGAIHAYVWRGVVVD